MSALSPTAKALVELMAEAQRGPRREGLFALWLLTRLIEDLGHPAGERTFKRRLALLERRLSSVGLSQSMRKGVGATLSLLKEPARPDRATLFAQLAAPAKDGIGSDAAEVLLRAAKQYR